MNFVKMHGLGNDFIVLDCTKQDTAISSESYHTLAKNLCDRHLVSAPTVFYWCCLLNGLTSVCVLSQ